MKHAAQAGEDADRSINIITKLKQIIRVIIQQLLLARPQAVNASLYLPGIYTHTDHQLVFVVYHRLSAVQQRRSSLDWFLDGVEGNGLDGVLLRALLLHHACDK
ncbi:hypothetical protein HC256_001099 [Beauveria bassiana]|nr:hypothetical protein HC256_001099 [Beauveria bassiana]